MTRTITAFYDTRSDAEAAVERLVEFGVARGEISIHDAASTSHDTTTVRHEEKGFWASLGDLFVPDDDRYSYEEGIRRGGSLLTVRAEDADFDRISDILEETGSVDLDRRETEWKSEGWSGYEAGRPTSLRSDLTGSDRVGSTGFTSVGTTTATGLETQADLRPTPSAYKSDRSADLGRDGTIEVIEENLRVGKRDVSHGRVRVRSYVVEDAVSEDVNLRNERVEIERRTVDRPVSSLDAAFRDQTLELEETAEEAVVSKEARVKEEIDLTRVVENRTETVSDTVRRTEVEIEDERAGRAAVTGATVTEDELARKRRSL